MNHANLNRHVVSTCRCSVVLNLPRRFQTLVLVGLSCWGFSAWADADIDLSGSFTTDQEYVCATDTTVNLNGVEFTDCTLKFRSKNEAQPVTITLNLLSGTQNVFMMENENQECIKATKKTNLIIDGEGSLELTSKKRITDKDTRSGVLVCNDLTVLNGRLTVTFDKDKSDTSCIFLKGNYLQTGGRVKVDLKQKNCTNEFHGVTLDSESARFDLRNGVFKAEISGTKSRAINLQGAGTATFSGGEVSAEFEGPEGRFVNGGKVVFSGGTYSFTTNVTAKMTTQYWPERLTAVKADTCIEITGGDFEAELPLVGSEVFSTDSVTGTYVEISGGKFDLVSGDDCVSARGNIRFSGGEFRGVSLFDDVFDANRDMVVSGGSIRAYATAEDTHGLDVNHSYKLTISGGVVIATDGPGADLIGSGVSTVGQYDFQQSTYYGRVATSDYSGKYLVLNGQTNGVPFTVKPRLPAFPDESFSFGLLVSVPGRTASVPVPKDAAQAYSDARSHCPLEFERKASLEDHTITTKEGESFSIPDYYDVDPPKGKSKLFTLTLNNRAAPVWADPSVDGRAAIEKEGSVVRVGVRTLEGLVYRLIRVDALPAAEADWRLVGDAVAGDGCVKVLEDRSRTDPAGFYRVRVAD